MKNTKSGPKKQVKITPEFKLSVFKLTVVHCIVLRIGKIQHKHKSLLVLVLQATYLVASHETKGNFCQHIRHFLLYQLVFGQWDTELNPVNIIFARYLF